MRRLRLLWVTPHLPRRGVNAARERWWALLHRLSRRHAVTLVAFAEPDEVGLAHALPPGLEAVHVVPRAACLPDDPLARLPRAVRWSFGDPTLAAAVRARLTADRFDLAQFEYAEMAHLIPASPVPTVLTIHQLLFAAARPRWQAEGRGLRRGVDALVQYVRDLDFELRALGRARHVITMSAEDARRLRSFVPDARVSVSPCGVDCEEFRPPAHRPPAEVDILFVGHFGHPPNVDAVRFLADEVLPRLRRPARVRVVGRDLPAALAGRAGIEFTGPVPDVRPHLAAARVVVAPVRFGTGMRGKVLEALAMGRPVVTTSLGAEGLGVTPGRHCLVADDAGAFATALERVLADDGLAANLGAEGRRLVASRFDWDAIAAAHEELYETVLREPAPPASVPGDRAEALERIGRHLGRWPAFALGMGLLGVRALRWHAGRRTPTTMVAGGPPLVAAGRDAATP